MGEGQHGTPECDLPIPVLVEGSSDEEDGGDAIDGGNDDWGPEDDAPSGGKEEGDVDDVVLEAALADEPRHSNRERRGVPPLRFIEMFLAVAAEEEAKQSPASVEEALSGEHKGKWEEAMRIEMDSLKEIGVYELVDKPKGKKVVKSKWVLRVKTNKRGEIDKYEARVVAKGYSQVEGVDYDRTFSPTVRFESIRQLVAIGHRRG